MRTIVAFWLVLLLVGAPTFAQEPGNGTEPEPSASGEPEPSGSSEPSDPDGPDSTVEPYSEDRTEYTPLPVTAKGDVPSWATIPGTKIIYDVRIEDVDEALVESGTFTMEVLQVNDDTITFGLASELSYYDDTVGEITVQRSDGEIVAHRTHGEPWLTGMTFWGWIPEVVLGDIVRFWSFHHEVKAPQLEGTTYAEFSDNDGQINLMQFETGSRALYSFVYHHPDMGYEVVELNDMKLGDVTQVDGFLAGLGIVGFLALVAVVGTVVPIGFAVRHFRRNGLKTKTTNAANGQLQVHDQAMGGPAMVPTATQTTAAAFCTDCGAGLNPGQAFCSGCGGKVDA